MNSTNIACKSAVTLAFHLLNRSFQAQALVIGEWVSVTVLGPSRHGSGEGVPGLLVRLDDPDTDDVSVPDDGHHLRLTPKPHPSLRRRR